MEGQAGEEEVEGDDDPGASDDVESKRDTDGVHAGEADLGHGVREG